MLKHQLPRIYEKILPTQILQMNPTETLATCDQCAMNVPTQKIWYKPDLKCCTFHPFMPNYLMGAIFTNFDQLPVVTQNQILKKIENREYVLPIGFVPPVSLQVEFNQRVDGDFGQRRDWICPYFNREQNNCGIWRNRGGVCTSFFCKSDYGEKGIEFYEQLGNYLNYVEMCFMEEALIRLDFSPRQLSELLSYINRHEATAKEMKSPFMDEKLARKLWNGYYEDQIGFFKKCFEIVQNLTSEEIEEGMGELGLRQQKLLIKSYQKLKI